jgi:hypothetical protein
MECPPSHTEAGTENTISATNEPRDSCASVCQMAMPLSLAKVDIAYDIQKKTPAKTDQRIILVGVLMDVDPIACRLMLEIGQA